MNTNNKNTRTDTLQRVSTTDQMSAEPRKDVIYGVSTTTISAVRRGLLQGMAIALGFFGTTIFAVAISGTIKTWTSGEVLKSADLNTTVSSMKTAIEGIPNWTKAANGTDAYYTAGNVGIGTSSPQTTLDVASTVNNFITLTRTNKSSGTGEFNLNVESNSQATISFDSTSQLTIGTSTDPSSQAGYSEKMRITSGGAVGIGITSPAYTLHVNGGVAGYTAYTNLSDERYKKNIHAICSPMDKILKLRGVNYEWRQSEFKDMKFKSGKDIGFIGQEVEKLIPEAVSKDENGVISLAYSNILPIVVEAFKELKKDHDLVRAEKSASDKKVSALEAEVLRLKTENKRLLSLEDRIRAVETMQIAQASTAAAARK